MEEDDSVRNGVKPRTPLIVDDHDEGVDGDDANQLGDDAVDGSVRHEENHDHIIHVLGLQKQQKSCSLKWIVAYAVVFMVVLITLTGTVLLYFLPQALQADKYNLSVHKGMMLLPIQPSPSMISHLTVTYDNEQCIAQHLYLLPYGLAPNVSHDANYSKDPEELGYQFYIYCLEKSTFYFELDDEDVDSVCFCLFIGDPRSFDTCEVEAGVSQCVHLNQTNKSASISVWATGYQGSFYSWRHWPNGANVKYHLDRYYYDSTLYGDFLQQPSHDNKVEIKLHNVFSPTHLSSEVYLFLESQCTTGDVSIQPYKRSDILVWPGLASILAVAILFTLSTGHLVCYKIKRKQQQLAIRQNLAEMN